MVNSDAKKNGINVPPRIGSKPRFRKSILYSIIAVIVVVIVVVSVVVVLPHFTGPRFEFISLSTAQKFTNTTLSESKVIILNLYIYYPNSTSKNFDLTKNYNSLYPPVLVNMVYLNSNNGSGTMGIAIYKFPGSSLSSQFYNGAVSHIINFTSAPLDSYSEHDLTFQGFKYSFVSDLNISYGFAYKGSIFLSVLDQGIPINNFNLSSPTCNTTVSV